MLKIWTLPDSLAVINKSNIEKVKIPSLEEYGQKEYRNLYQKNPTAYDSPIRSWEEWSKDQGLSSNGVFALHSFYESNGRCTQKMISEKWNIPKQKIK